MIVYRICSKNDAIISDLNKRPIYLQKDGSIGTSEINAFQTSYEDLAILLVIGLNMSYSSSREFGTPNTGKNFQIEVIV